MRSSFFFVDAYSSESLTIDVNSGVRYLAQDRSVSSLVPPQQRDDRDCDADAEPVVDVDDDHGGEGRYPDERVELAALPRPAKVGKLDKEAFEGGEDDGGQDALAREKK